MRHDRLLKAVSAVKDFGKAILAWILLTSRSPWKLENIKQVLVEVTSVLQDAVSRQADPTLSLVRSAYRAIARNDLVTAEPLYDEAIRLNPIKSETYFLRAKYLTHLKGNAARMDEELRVGVELDKMIAEKAGLDALNLKILGNEFAGMGHLSLLDPLIKLKHCGLVSNRHLMVVTDTAVANIAYLNCWRRYLPIIVTNAKNYSAITGLLSPLLEEVAMFEAVSGYVPLYEAWNLALNAWADSSPLLELSHEQKESGARVLARMGMPEDSWFVGLHVRDGAKGGYLRSGADAEILDYLPAIQRITDVGGWVIRMGKGAKPVNSMRNLRDYANSEHRSDWMDVYLWASCRFFIGTSSGPLSVPPTFGRPVLSTNATNIGLTPNFRSSLMVPKLFWSNRKRGHLTFTEMLEGPYGWTVLPQYDDGETRLVANSPQEIRAAVDEMIRATEHDCSYPTPTSDQEAFDRRRERFKSTSQMRVADSFLKAHPSLLS